MMSREFTNMAIELCFPPEGADAVLSVGCLPRTWFSIFVVPPVYVISVLQRLFAFHRSCVRNISKQKIQQAAF